MPIRSARPRPGRFDVVAGVLSMVLACAGCGSGGTAPDAGQSTTAIDPTTSARTLLAGRAAAARDRNLVASYTLRTHGRPDRTVDVTIARDGSWRVDIPRGALGGTADVSVARTAAGLYQCRLPSAEHPVAPGCVRVAGPHGALPDRYDPGVEHPFTDWRSVLTDQQAALAVAPARAPDGVSGDCFAVDSTAASLAAPLDAGIYCYAADGTLTGAELGFGTLVLSGDPGPGPSTVTLPGPVTPGPAMGMSSPPPPSASPSQIRRPG